MAGFERWKFPKRRPIGFNYYRDLFLVWPFLLFSISALVFGFADSSPENTRAFHAFAIGAGICILLAKEKLYLVLGALAFVSVRLFTAMPVANTWHPLVLLAACVGLAILLFEWTRRRGYEPSYQFPEAISILDLIVGLTGLGTALLIGLWIRS